MHRKIQNICTSVKVTGNARMGLANVVSIGEGRTAVFTKENNVMDNCFIAGL